MMALTCIPLIPLWALGVFFLLFIGFAVYAVIRGVSGSIFQMLSFTVACVWLINPSITREVYRPTPAEVAVVLDQSASMNTEGRAQIARDITLRLQKAAKGVPGLHLRFLSSEGPHSKRTDLFKTLQDAGLNAARFAGAIFVTDGMVHDAPKLLPKLFLPDDQHAARPLDVILTGAGETVDRRLEILEAPTYGVVGKNVSIVFRVVDEGETRAVPAEVTIEAGGETRPPIKVQPGVKQSVTVPIHSAGDFLVVVRASPLKNEVSTRNNTASLHINGIRERLKVLLVSGRPNPGERVWRRLLRADSSVDLVHFTILRAPDQDDGTPTRDMALVVFPTQDLFQNRIDQFDLIILDGFRTMGLLPDSYMENIAQFVRKGGGLLLLTGPEFVEEGSLGDTPLSAVLPAAAQDNGISNEKFTPQLTALGHRHPVVSSLPQGWGPWYRSIKVRPESVKGDVVLQGPQAQPLLILNKVDKGRVAMLMSDQIWLWSRGESGGGPQAQLLRRLAHWLMKEPSLEPERLTGKMKDNTLVVTRYTAQSQLSSDAIVSRPNGETKPLRLIRTSDGIYTGQMQMAADVAACTVRQDGLKVLVAPEEDETPERRDLRATATILTPLVRRSGGKMTWSAQIGPDFRLAIGKKSCGAGTWCFPTGFAADPTQTRSYRLIPPWVGLSIIVSLIFLGWLRERKF